MRTTDLKREMAMAMAALGQRAIGIDGPSRQQTQDDSPTFAQKPRRKKRNKDINGRCPDTIDLFFGTQWAAPPEAEAAHQLSNPSPEKGSGHD